MAQQIPAPSVVAGMRQRGGSGSKLFRSVVKLFHDAESKVKPSLSSLERMSLHDRRRKLRNVVIIITMVCILALFTNRYLIQQGGTSFVSIYVHHSSDTHADASELKTLTPRLRVEDYPDIPVADSEAFRPRGVLGSAFKNPNAPALRHGPVVEDTSNSAGENNRFGNDHGSSESSTVSLAHGLSAVKEVMIPTGISQETEPHIRIIVITMDRDKSLDRLLKSLQAANYDGDRADLDIWIDRGKEDDSTASATMERVTAVARACKWDFGVRSIYQRSQNAGLYEQWIYTWNVTEDSTETAVILEDDLEVSEHFYIWLRSARQKYSNDPSIAALTLQRGELRPRQVKGVATGKLHVDKSIPAFKYKLLGTWGFSPQKSAWLEFRAWYEDMRAKKAKPYVSGLVTTDWYKKQEAGREYAPTMWSQWFIKFSDVKNYFTLYANLPDKSTLASNWREGGMHYSDKPRSADFPTFKGPSSMLALPENLVQLDWDGREIERSRFMM